MRVVAIAVAGLLLAGETLQAQEPPQAPTCRAGRRGEDLITRIQFPDGYMVEGPWHVTGQSPTTSKVTLITAVLDHIVETQAVSHKQQTTSLPSAIEMTFHGASFDEVLTQAANIWCMTVLQARPPWQMDVKPAEVPGQNRITLD